MAASPTTIQVRNAQRKFPVNVAALEAFAKRALPLCLRAGHGKRTLAAEAGEIFVVLISDRRMAQLHQRFLGQTGPTDVITFEHGEIFISVETARRNARRFGNSFRRELELYIVHGLLHLCGFDDSNRRAARKMRVAESRVISAVTV
jgi:probable rRNA maturation factor